MFLLEKILQSYLGVRGTLGYIPGSSARKHSAKTSPATEKLKGSGFIGFRVYRVEGLGFRV